MYSLPVIHSAGTFDSSNKFRSVTQTPERVVTEYELELYHQEGGVSILNGNEYPIRRGLLLIACPGDRRSTTLPFRNHFIRLVNADESFASLFRAVSGAVLLEDDEACRTVFEHVSAWFLSDDPYYRAAAAAEIFQLLRIVRSQSKQRMHLERREDDVVQQAQEYIDKHYHEAFGVEELARVCHVSAPYLHRLFVAHLSSTPHAALTRRRVLAAKALLVNSREPISQIAWKCGFQSASYFSDCFRRHEGMLPRKFRKETGYQL